jgi:hypothetical protein
MSDALYLHMFNSVNTVSSSQDRKRARRRKVWDSIGKAAAYAVAILGTASVSADFAQTATVSGAILLAIEMFR